MKRFWDKVDKSKHCWNWTAATRNGYGCLKFEGKVHDAHRVAWLLTHDRWPTEWILHTCDNRLCVRPAHLLEGNRSDAVYGAIAKGRHHTPYVQGERVASAKFTESQVQDIREAHASRRIGQRGLARKYGVHRATIGDIVTKRQWKHVLERDVMTRGTRDLFGQEALEFTNVRMILERLALEYGFIPFIPSALSDQETFINKAGTEVLGQMYTFKDKGDRDICLTPEVTAVVQKLYKENWNKSLAKPIKLFYFTRCYRYERPQAGRYREFWQFGIEILGEQKGDKSEALMFLERCLQDVGLKNYRLNLQVKRGLNYYVEDGFEVEVEKLGAQKQIAGGGRYEGGIGWAIGVDRLLLALP